MNKDVTIVCRCGESFVFTEGEQKFYEERDFVQPKWCPDCRRKRKQEKDFRRDTPFPER